MKIAVLTEQMISGYGVDLVVHEQAKRLAKIGHDVRVFVFRAQANEPSEAYALEVLSRPNNRNTGFQSVHEIRSWLKHIGAKDFDVFMLHTPLFYAWISQLDAPVAVVEYGCPPGTFFDSETAYALWKMVSNHFRFDYGCLRKGDAVVAISRYIDEGLPKVAIPYSTVQLLGADHYAKATVTEAAQFRSAHDIGQDDFLVLWVGRMQLKHDDQPYKGFQELLLLLPEIKAISPNIKIALLGKIDAGEQHQLDSSGVVLLANLPSAEMGVAYAAANVLLNISKWEGFNLALVEAQYQGTPVIALDLGPHREVCQPNETSLLVSRVEDVVSAVKELFDAPHRLREMSANARAFAQRFSWDENARALNETLEKCVRDGAELVGVERMPVQVKMPRFSRSVSYHELLLLEGRKFVRAAFHSLLNREIDRDSERFFLEQLQESNQLEVLLKISGSLEGQAAITKIPRLDRYRKMSKARRRYRLWRDLRRAKRLFPGGLESSEIF